MNADIAKYQQLKHEYDELVKYLKQLEDKKWQIKYRIKDLLDTMRSMQ